MNNKVEEELQFWEYDDKGKPKILQSKLIGFLESKGFVNIKVSNTNYLLIRERNNRISECSIEVPMQIIRDYLCSYELFDVYETFAKGVGAYLGGRKLGLLNSIDLINDRDGRDNSCIYFKNCFINITSDEIKLNSYSELKGAIWENRILDRSFKLPKDKFQGQFEMFCWNLSKKDDKRFKALKMIIGYLLHRNRERGEDRAIILYDEKMGLYNQAHGGTGKTLLSDALNQIREVVDFDGKNVKIGSWFRNQRVNLTTDVLAYDDLEKSTSLENFFAIITGKVEVEKKRMQAFQIPKENAPKLIITSNYLVLGPGGNSDKRRRHEFEIANHYNEDYQPEDEFGNRFFESDWEDEQWNKFYHFMMQCIQVYLSKGLINVEPINLLKARKESTSCKEFVDFAELMFEFNKWNDKREFDILFKTEYTKYKDVSSKMITKWLTAFAMDKGGKILFKSSGGDYLTMIELNEDEEEV